MEEKHEKTVGTNESAAARVFRISLSERTGDKKHNVGRATLVPEGGIVGDAHYGTARPLSLLPLESFSKVRRPELNIQPGDFAENITTVGLDFSGMRIGSRLRLGKQIEIEVLQIGKECHNGCVIRELSGDCIMPREGVFARIVTGGVLEEGDPVTILS
jgi:MOSC domain-containing protein YiiM